LSKVFWADSKADLRVQRQRLERNLGGDPPQKAKAGPHEKKHVGPGREITGKLKGRDEGTWKNTKEGGTKRVKARKSVGQDRDRALGRGKGLDGRNH